MHATANALRWRNFLSLVFAVWEEWQSDFLFTLLDLFFDGLQCWLPILLLNHILTVRDVYSL